MRETQRSVALCLAFVARNRERHDEREHEMNVWEDQHDSGGGWPPSRGRAVVARCAWTALSVACERDASRIVHVSVARRRLRGSFAVALCDAHASFVVLSDETEHGHALRVVRVERAS